MASVASQVQPAEQNDTILWMDTTMCSAGGNDIEITRSKDLIVWEKRNMSLATHCIAEEICPKYRKPCTETATTYEECYAQSPDCTTTSGEGSK